MKHGLVDKHGIVYGVVWAMLMNLTSSINDVIARFLGDRLHFVEIAFFRFLFSTIVILIPILCTNKRCSLFKSVYHKEHLWRGILGCLAIGLCCFSVNNIPLAENTTILFADTLFMIPLAAIFLHEKIGLKSVIATMIGMTGLIIMYRPSADNINLHALAPTIAAFLFAVMNIIIKKMVDNQENNLTMLFYFGLYTTIMSSIFVPFYWEIPSFHELLLLFILGICSNLIQLFLFLAFRATLATYITPLRYTELPFSVLLGYLFFTQIPDSTTIMGSILIVIGTFIVSTFSKESGGRK